MSSEGEGYAPEGYVVLPIPAEFIKGSRAQQNKQSEEEGDEKLIKFQRPKAGISRAEQFARNCRVQDRDRIAFEEEAALQKVLKKKYPGAKFAPVSQMADKEEPVKQYTAKGKGKKGTSNSNSMMMMSDGDGKETKKNREEEEEEEEQSAGLGLGDFQKPKQKKKNGSGAGKKEKSSSSSMSLGGEDEDEDADEEEAVKPVVVKAKPSIEIRGKRKMTAPAVVELDDEEDQMDSSDNNKSRVVFVAPPTDGKSSEGIAEWDLPDPDMLAGFRRTEGKDMAERMNKYSDNFREKTVAELRKQLEKAKEKKAQVQQQQKPVSMMQEQQRSLPSSSSSGNASQSQGGSSMDETS